LSVVVQSILGLDKGVYIMNLQELENQLLEAGMKFDGHVTNGSMAAQMKIVKKALAAVILDPLELPHPDTRER
jgi:hypothetical protein